MSLAFASQVDFHPVTPCEKFESFESSLPVVRWLKLLGITLEEKAAPLMMLVTTSR